MSNQAGGKPGGTAKRGAKGVVRPAPAGTKRGTRRRSAPGPLPGRMAMVMISVAGAFIVILAQLVNLQVLDAPRLASRAENQHHKTIRLAGERGTITDRNGAILAKNMDVPSISADPSKITKPRATARSLAKVLPVSAKGVEKRLKGKGRHFSWVYRKADPTQAAKVMALKLPGIHQIPESRRFYPKGELLGHILGFAGMDNQGLSGIEQVYNKALQGKKITVVVERDALGRSIMPTDSRYDRPDHGADITLTIDEVIQYHVERELDKAMATTKAKGAQAIVMDPRTGEILAMAVRPKFDPNRAGSFKPEEARNRLITDPYEPGSTMKIFLAATALKEGVVTLEEKIDCENGRMPLRGGAMHDTHAYESLSFEQVLVKSSNIGSAKVGMRLGEDRLYNGLLAFGFGKKTGIELAGESAGLLYPVKRWSGRSLASVAIGQELAVTPIQLVTAAAAVANGGKLMRPYLVKSVKQGQTTTTVHPEARRRVMSKADAADLRRALVGVTEKGGTATQAAIPGYNVAGKTGTAQKADLIRGGYAKGKYVSSFLGMVPAEDPRLVMLVVIDEAQGKYYGGTVAAPVFKAVATPSLQYMGVHPKTDRTITLAANGASL